MHLEVQVRRTGVTGHADVADDLARLHLRADRQTIGERTEVAVEEVGAVGPLQAPAVAGERSGRVDVLLRERAVVDGVHEQAGLGDDVDTLVRAAAGSGRAPGVGEPTRTLHRELADRDLHRHTRGGCGGGRRGGDGRLCRVDLGEPACHRQAQHRQRHERDSRAPPPTCGGERLDCNRLVGGTRHRHLGRGTEVSSAENRGVLSRERLPEWLL